MADREPWSDGWDVRSDRVAVAVGDVHGLRRSRPVTVRHPSETLRVPFGDDDEAAATASSWTGTTPPDSALQGAGWSADVGARGGVEVSVGRGRGGQVAGADLRAATAAAVYASSSDGTACPGRAGGGRRAGVGGGWRRGSRERRGGVGGGSRCRGAGHGVSVLNHVHVEVTGASEAGALAMYGQALPGGLRIESGDELVRRIRGEARRRLERHRMQEQMAVRRRERGAVASSERRHRAVPRYASRRSASSTTTPSAPALSGSKSPRYALALSETDRPSGSSVGSDGGRGGSSVDGVADDEGKYRDGQGQNAAAAVTEVSGDLARLDMRQRSPLAVTPRASTSSSPSSRGQRPRHHHHHHRHHRHRRQLRAAQRFPQCRFHPPISLQHRRHATPPANSSPAPCNATCRCCARIGA
eukprot:ctg_4689.g680